MKNDCGDLSALLGAHLDGELDTARAAQVEAHLATCARCRRELEALRQLHRLVRKAGPPELRDDYWDWHRTRVWRRLNEDTREHQRFFRPSFAWPKLATLAGGLVVVLVVAVVGWQTLGPGLTQHGKRAAADDHLTVTGTSPSPAGQTESEPPALATGKVVSRGAAEPVHAEAGERESREGGRATLDEGRMVEPATGASRSGQPAAVVTLATKKTEPRDKDRVGSAPGEKTGAVSESSVIEVADDEFRQAKVESLAGFLKGGAVFQIVGAKPQPKRVDVRPTPVGVQPVPATDDTGTAIVSLTTDTLGAVVDASIARSSGKPKLDSIALSMARKSRFSPGKRDGKLSRFSFEQTYQFNNLRKKKTSK